MRYALPALALLLPALAAAAPVQLPVQGQLADAAGVAVDGTMNVTFRLYHDPSDTVPGWQEVIAVDFDQGAFTAYLGGAGNLDSELFRLDQSVWLGIQIQGDVEMDPIEIGWTPLAAFAAHAGDAETLDGMGSADFLPSTWRPNWSDIQGRPAGLDDGDDVGTGGTGFPGYDIGEGLLLDGVTLFVDTSQIQEWAQDVCFDSESELRAALDDVYAPLGASSTVPWGDVLNKPAGFADDIDNDTQYSAGAGLDLTGTVFSLEQNTIEGWARGVCLDTEGELRGLLDDVYAPLGADVGWADLTGIPAGFADGTDDGTTYDAGTGLVLAGTTFAADRGVIEGWAQGVCFDREGELTALLDDNYLPASYAPAWSSLTGVPAGFADGVDNGVSDWSQLAGIPAGFADGVDNDNNAWSALTGVPAGFADNTDNDAWAGFTCPAGQSPQHNGSAWACADVRPTADNLATALDNQDINLGAGTTINGVPIATAVGDTTYGRVPSNPGTSCKDIKQQDPSAQDGLYLIDLDGSGSNLPFQVYCDMTRDGGGWTLIMRVWYGSGLAGQAGNVGNPQPSIGLRTSPYKMSDVNVRTVIGADNNFDILVDQEYWNTGYSNGNHEYVIVRNYTGVYTYTAPVPESSTPTVFESYRWADNAIAWRGRLGCGKGGYGINCYDILTIPLSSQPLGAGNPQGGLGCLISMGYSSNPSWHNLYQGETNTDTYIYICNSAQHTSSYSNAHRWWVR